MEKIFREMQKKTETKQNEIEMRENKYTTPKSEKFF